MAAYAHLRTFDNWRQILLKETLSMLPHVRLAEWWTATSSGIVVDKTDPALITALEERYDISLPSDFRSYLCFSCPQNDPSLDNELSNWWPIEKIESISDYNDYKIKMPLPIIERANKTLIFADFCIWCFAWAICCDESEHRGKVAIIGGGDQFVASSFAEFVDLYIEEPLSVIF